MDDLIPADGPVRRLTRRTARRGFDAVPARRDGFPAVFGRPDGFAGDVRKAPLAAGVL